MPVIEVRFKLEKEPEGALRYQEVDEKGEVIEQAWAKIGTLYVPKSAFERGSKPLAHENGVGRGAPFPGCLLPPQDKSTSARVPAS
jgi:hypothetical protein